MTISPNPGRGVPVAGQGLDPPSPAFSPRCRDCGTLYGYDRVVPHDDACPRACPAGVCMTDCDWPMNPDYLSAAMRRRLKIIGRARDYTAISDHTLDALHRRRLVDRASVEGLRLSERWTLTGVGRATLEAIS